MRRTTIAAACTAAVSVLALAACGSSGSGGASGPSASGGTAAQGAPIKVMGTGTLSGTNDPYPEIQGGLQAASAEINAAGGIKGHPIEFEMCDDQANPNIAQSCAEKAAANHDVAVLTGNDNQTPSLLPTLANSHIAMIGSGTNYQQDATSPVSFPLSPSSFNALPQAGATAAKAGCKKVSSVVIELSSITASLVKGIDTGLRLEHIQNVGTLTISATSTDFAPSVAAAVQKGADCVVGVVSEPQTTAFLSAVQRSGGKVTPIVPGQNLAPLGSLGAIAEGAYVFANGRQPTDPSEGVKAASQAIAEYSGGTPITATSLQAFAAVQLLKAALEQVTGGYTAGSVLAAMNNLSSASTGGLFPPYTTAKATGIPGQPREFNPDFLIYRVGNQKAVPMGGFVPTPGL